MIAKEAFRYVSHEFHGEGPGKNKVEKRMKRTEQEGLMKQMSSTDTHLDCVASCSRSRKKCSFHTRSLVAVNRHEAAISKTKLQILHEICWHQL
ncbi:U4/U6.U5 tri-snRNP-associated protein 1-like [Cryptotermes secundus]|uniref:U4/U6.U5 tri-snRNP-associated protein 1-like n=1 Tax=Cryptotermes secundus TaxID=105785 RepID=UPI000CD7B30B|nr:U4/U6.U5 tri-snRNP-associated protein 1-like [Cryptotermes secundus]